MKETVQKAILGIMAGFAVICMSCQREQIPVFTVVLTYGDYGRESREISAGSMLWIPGREGYTVAEVIGGKGDALDLKVTRYGVARDTVKAELLLRRTHHETGTLSAGEETLLDPGNNVRLSLESVAMMDTGKRPLGACQAECCKATCFSTICCADIHECRDVPCDCKPPANCPGTPSGVQIARVLELYRSGKEMMVVNDEMPQFHHVE